MHRLNIYLNDNRLEKLKILTGETDTEKIEEWLNETIYNAIYEAWLNHKSAAIGEMLASGDLDNETTRVTVDGIESDVWSDGEMAVLDYKDNTATVQLIDSKYYYVLENGTRVECSEETCKEIQKILNAAGVKLKNFSKEELDKELIYKGEEK